MYAEICNESKLNELSDLNGFCDNCDKNKSLKNEYFSIKNDFLRRKA